MNILIINFILCLIWAICVQTFPSQRLRNDFFLIPVFIVITYFHTFVDIYSIPDLETYYYAFSLCESTSWADIPSITTGGYVKMELGFLYLMKLVTVIGVDFRFFLFITSLIVIIPYFIIAKKYSPFTILTVLLFLISTYNQSLFVLRQHIAIALTLCTYPYIIQRNLPKFLFVMVIAFFFHKTSVLFVPIYFIYGVRERKKFIVLFALIGVLGTLVLPLIFQYFGGLLGGYESYLSDDENITNAKTGILSLLLLLTYIICAKKEVLNPGINKLILCLMLLSTVVNIGGIGLPLIGRVALYYSVINCVAIPHTCLYIKNIAIRYTYIIAVVAVFVYISFYGSAVEHLRDFAIIHPF